MSRNAEGVIHTLTLSGHIESGPISAQVVEFIVRDALDGGDVIVYERTTVQ